MLNRLFGPGRVVAISKMKPMPGIEESANWKLVRRTALHQRDCPLEVLLKLRVSKCHMLASDAQRSRSVAAGPELPELDCTGIPPSTALAGLNEAAARGGGFRA